MTISKSRIKKLEEAFGLNNMVDEDLKLIRLTFINENREKKIETLTRKNLEEIINKVYGNGQKSD